MNSLRGPYSRRGIRLSLRAQASLTGRVDRPVFWLIVTAFLLTTSPNLIAQANDNPATVGGRIAEQARTPALPGNTTTMRGRGADVAGAILTGASVTLGNLATGLERGVTTGANGNFAFAASNGARRRLIVSTVGFAPISSEVNPASALPVN